MAVRPSRLARLVLAVVSSGAASAAAQPPAATAAPPAPRPPARMTAVPVRLPPAVREAQLKTVVDLERTRAARRAEGDAAGEAETLNALGAAQQRLGDPGQALASYEEALRIARGGEPAVAAKPRSAAPATAPAPPGGPRREVILPRLARPPPAVAGAPARPAPEAAATVRDHRARRVEAAALTGMGVLRAGQGERARALVHLKDAIAIHAELGDRAAEATTAGAAAAVHRDLGRNRLALELYEREIPLRRALGDAAGEAAALKDEAGVYRAMGQHDRAAETLRASIEVANRAGNPALAARALAELGAVRVAKGEKREGAVDLERALTLARAARDREAEASALHGMGTAQLALRDRVKAADAFRKALALRRAARQPAGETETLASLSALTARRRPAFAAFLAKKAVRTYAAARAERRGLDRELRGAFAAAVSAHRVAVGPLIAQRRVAEALQLAIALKDLEGERAAEGDGAPAAEAADAAAEAGETAPPAGGGAAPQEPVTLTPAERAADARYEDAARSLTELTAEWEALVARPQLGPDDLARLDELWKQIDQARKEFEALLERLAAELPAQRIADLREDVGLKGAIAELGPGAVAIFVVLAEDEVWAVLVTGAGEKPVPLPDTPAELREKVAALRAAIADRTGDPTPQAHALYRAVVEPLERELRGADTLMWWLDGPLRYAPLAALWDGERWLVQRYRNVVLSRLSAANLKDAPAPTWTVLGLGVTKEHAPLAALPGVRSELEAVVSEEQSEETGILRGRRLLDEQFTRATMVSALLRRRPVIHIASHYVLRPVRGTTEGADPDPSYLLLGDGTFLTLPELKSLPPPLLQVDLVALSACDTALGSDDPEGTLAGAELDGLARVAQQQGAKAVLATLWNVADASTPALMREFYRLREADGGRSKAAALQEAQLAMLQGRLGPAPAGGDADRGGTVERPAPRFPDWTHPYHWAPFVLLGNWK
ncbi:MAG TPA: CHAT domain-containing protein [Anaeromyxobacter sp.]|nr:CHAT domain-containing protein [Anaeromyxobacter sp.]